ncbi:hypothetical protein BpHYR1_040294 [Brachionus plicatilis]|uniref:Retrovirus-related Pol poly from transposon n=1 Tax=Brachionus plicatilis TaxID=10195 RepID=A0A3M7PM12_BRAPC|nr:hypothetical protein BpHYR1_040294 [Brachionus plicatilis]
MARYVGSNKSNASINKFYHYAKNDSIRPQYYQKTYTGLKKKPYGHVKKDCKSKYKDKCHKKINVANAISAIESSADEDHCNMTAEGKLLTSRGLIDGKPMKIAFDCGQIVSIISNKMINKHVMETIPTNKKVKIADNSVLKIDKMTKKIEVNIKGHICFLEFWVIDNQENDPLLGLDWFNLTGAGVFPNQNTITFPSETIILDSDMNDDEISEGILTTEGIHDQNIFEEEWHLDKTRDKFECKPEQKLDYTL